MLGTSGHSSDATGNYRDASGTVTDVIAPGEPRKTATITIDHPYNVTY